MLSRASAVLLNLLLMSAGCDGCEAAHQDSEDAALLELGSRSGATLTGRVRLAPGELMPSYLVADLERTLLDAPPADSPGGCGAAELLGKDPVRLTDAGTLSGMVVAASGFTAHRPRRNKTHVLRMRGCRLDPPLIVAMRGDELEIVNDLDHAISPVFGPAPLAVALEPGEKWKFKLDRAGVESVMCGAQARCGRADVVVMHHPVHTITDARGQFELRDFPVGQSVKVNAWHPLFQEAHAYVWLERDQRVEVELQVQPLPTGSAR